MHLVGMGGISLALPFYFSGEVSPWQSSAQRTHADLEAAPRSVAPWLRCCRTCRFAPFSVRSDVG